MPGFTSFLLAHPDNRAKQDKLLAEIDAFGRDRVPTLEDLDTLPYLDAVFKESLRLYPPAYLTTREAEEDIFVEGKPSHYLNVELHAEDTAFQEERPSCLQKPAGPGSHRFSMEQAAFTVTALKICVAGSTKASELWMLKHAQCRGQDTQGAVDPDWHLCNAQKGQVMERP